MSGITQQLMVGAGANIVTHNSTIVVGYYTATLTYRYGYKLSPACGSISGENTPAASEVAVLSSAADFSNPYTYVALSDPLGDFANATAFSITIGGINRTTADEWEQGTGTWVWLGDPFLLRSKNGQSLVVQIHGTW